MQLMHGQMIGQRLRGRFGGVVSHEQHPQHGASMQRPRLF
jgi:hypothetical protein